MVVSGVDAGEAVGRSAAPARAAPGADVGALALPGIDGTLVLEIIDGMQADELLGAEMPNDGRAAVVLEGEEGMVLDTLGMADYPGSPALGGFGPALFAPMRTAGRPVGVLILLRRVGEEQFDASDLDTAVSFARQAALAYVLAEARQARDAAALFDERERIARDLHDLAIQQLFATGMQLETVRRRAERGIAYGDLVSILDSALDNVDGSVREIRAIVHALRDPDAATSLVERLRREASLARTGLGFAPSLVVELDGAPVPDGASIAADQLDARVAPALSDDVVAVVREGLANAARHAHASSVGVRVAVTGAAPFGEVLVEVVDDGQGLAEKRERRSGTANLEERARQHRGTCELGPAGDEGGARLAWRAPLADVG
jgi:signal transduction histidine kinase